MASSKCCCVPKCDYTDFPGVLHSFPNPELAPDRFKTWLNAIGGDILKLDSEFVHKHRRVCRRHFERQYHCRNNRLSNIAVPTLKMPDYTNTCKTVDKEEKVKSQPPTVLYIKLLDAERQNVSLCMPVEEDTIGNVKCDNGDPKRNFRPENEAVKANVSPEDGDTNGNDIPGDRDTIGNDKPDDGDTTGNDKHDDGDIIEKDRPAGNAIGYDMSDDGGTIGNDRPDEGHTVDENTITFDNNYIVVIECSDPISELDIGY